MELKKIIEAHPFGNLKRVFDGFVSHIDNEKYSLDVIVYFHAINGGIKAFIKTVMNIEIIGEKMPETPEEIKFKT
jgi:hypothetical protein